MTDPKTATARPPLTDYHTHNFRCFHAEGDVPDYVAQALELGFGQIGASDHIPVSKPHYQGYRMRLETIPEYRDTVAMAREKWRGKIDVLYGIEAEYDEDPQTVRECESLFEREAFDYVIGSVHFFNGRDGQGIRGAVWDVVDRVDGPEREELVIRYFDLVGEMAATGLYDIAGHLDVIFRHIGGVKEPRGRLEKSILRALDSIADAGMSMEVNTSGRRYDKQEPFPSLWIIGHALDREISLQINSDAHAPDQVGAWHNETFEQIASLGKPVQFARYAKREKQTLAAPV
ncbi:histidinol-phosphatase, partial [Kamptonema cortianum]|nr:histidinol-phosphatase [Kamptonema cortianum]